MFVSCIKVVARKMKAAHGRTAYFCWLLICLLHGAGVLAGTTPPKKSKDSGHSTNGDSNLNKSKPNIVFIFADDLGYNDVGYNGKHHGSAVKTPNIDRLAAKGVILSNYYVQHLCTPTRSQLLTGRYQIHTGLQHSNIPPTRPYCLPLDEITLAEKLQEAGYSTHMVGKWHLGFQKKECLPTNRGFDSFVGLYLGSGDYFTHMKNWRSAFVHIKGYDFHRDTKSNTTVGYKYQGEYSTHVFSQRAQNLIKKHRKKKKPLFMYISFQAPHGPLQVPSRYKIPFSNTTMRGNRKTLAAMIYCMDEAIGNIVEELKDSGLYKNTIIIFSTDNGGAKELPASNWPYRGSKGTYWEGGIHGVGFVNSPLLPKRVRGTTSQAFIHVSDWFPTIVSSLAGGSLNGTKPLDGYDVWDAIVSGTASPRTELLHNINPRRHNPALKDSALKYPKIFNTSIQAALRMGDWKILTGTPGEGSWTAPPESNFESIERLDPPDKQIWLFNISADPYEQHDLSESNPSVVKQMLRRLQRYSDTMVTPIWPKMDNMYDPSDFGNVWGPWDANPIPTDAPEETTKPQMSEEEELGENKQATKLQKQKENIRKQKLKAQEENKPQKQNEYSQIQAENSEHQTNTSHRHTEKPKQQAEKAQKQNKSQTKAEESQTALDTSQEKANGSKKKTKLPPTKTGNPPSNKSQAKKSKSSTNASTSKKSKSPKKESQTKKAKSSKKESLRKKGKSTTKESQTKRGKSTTKESQTKRGKSTTKESQTKKGKSTKKDSLTKKGKSTTKESHTKRGKSTTKESLTKKGKSTKESQTKKSKSQKTTKSLRKQSKSHNAKQKAKKRKTPKATSRNGS